MDKIEANHSEGTESPEEIEWLRAQIEVGLASGICETPAKEIIRQIIADRRARRRA